MMISTATKHAIVCIIAVVRKMENDIEHEREEMKEIAFIFSFSKQLLMMIRMPASNNNDNYERHKAK
jgi:hypothetical protein